MIITRVFEFGVQGLEKFYLKHLSVAHDNLK